MKILKLRGSTSNILRVFLQDSRVTDGSGLTGLSSASSGLKIVTIADVEASVTSYTVAGSTIESITTLGTFATPTATKCRFKEIDSTNLPGWYEIQLDDTRFAVSNAKALQIMIFGASNLVPCNVEVQLAAGVDVDNATSAGLSRLDATVSSRASQTSLDTVDDFIDTEVAAIKTKTDQLVFTVANQVDVNVVDWKGSTAPAMTGDAFARLGAPAGASVSADIATVAGYVDTEVAAIKAKTDNLPSSPAATGDAMTLADGAITAAKIAADAITAAKIADGAIDTATLVDGCLTAAKIASDAITAAKIADGAIDAGAFAAGAITATVIATDAIDADALAADALTEIFTKVFTTAMTEAYAADGAAPTLAQMLFMLWSRDTEFSIAGTTLTAKKLDGSTTSMTFTLNDATDPTSITRAS